MFLRIFCRTVPLITAGLLLINVQAVSAKQSSPPAKTPPPSTVTITIDKSELNNGGAIAVTGTAPKGSQVYIEVFSEKKVRASRFDADVDKETGKRPYQLYLTQEMPAYYKIFTPKVQAEALGKIKKEGNKWSYSKALKDVGADVAYSLSLIHI